MKSSKSFFAGILAALFGFSILAYGNSFAANGVAPVIARAEFVRTKVHKWVRERTQNNSKTSVLVILKEQISDPTFADLQNEKPATRAEMIYKALADHSRTTQKPIQKFLKSKNIEFDSFYIVNAIGIPFANSKLIEELAMRPDVAKIVGDPILPMRLKPALQWSEQKAEMEFSALNASIAETGAPQMWAAGFKGQGIVVGGEDSGFKWDHPALKNQYRGWNGQQADHRYNWMDAVKRRTGTTQNPCGYSTVAPCDDGDHGTHTMGTMVGREGSEHEIGMAPEAKWIGCRNMDDGNGKPSLYLECFQFMLAPYPRGGNPSLDGRPDLGANVVNNSWSCPEDEGCQGDEFIPALQAMKAAGIMNVISASNDGPGCGTIANAPAHHLDLGLVVGAHNHRTGAIASFSSRGPSAFMGAIGPHLTAPGVKIKSSVPSGYDASFSGTSMAGPHAAGMVALIWSARPDLKGMIDQTISFMTGAALPTTTTESCGGVSGSAVPNNTFGFGRMRSGIR